MAYEDNGQRLVARVKLIEDSDHIAYLELPNGYIIPHHFDDDEDYSENDIVLIGPLLDDVERAPSALWPEVPWIGTVRVLLDQEVVVDVSGRLRTMPRNQSISLSVGNTIEGSDTKGILRVLAEKPIPLLEISLGEPFDVSRLREQPSGQLSYDDFGGYDEIKARTKELIELPLQQREALLKIRARPIKGVLFTGSSGTGKTLLGRIIAHQAKAQFYKISGPEIVSKYVGQSEEVIRAIFDDAKQQDRAIIFFDEIDSVAPQRSDESHESSRRLVGQLLTLMDGFDEDANIIVIATTNRPQDIDVALRRPGRFDWQIHFTLPTRDDREAILATTARQHHVADDLPHGVIAGRTKDWSPAELAAIWSDAALLAVLDGRDIIMAEDYFGGYERVATQKDLVAATQRNESKERTA